LNGIAMSYRRIEVEIRVLEDFEVVPYRGTLDEGTFDAITGNGQSEGFFRLDDVRWVDADADIDAVLRNGRLDGRATTAWFRVEDVRRIAVLAEAKGPRPRAA
jgi:hypothetical protein